MPVQSILVIRARYLGDLILTHCLIANLRSEFPQAKITLAADSLFSELLAQLDFADRVLPIPRGGGMRGRMLAWLPLVWALLSGPFDLVIDAHNSRTSRVLTCFALARRSIGWAGPKGRISPYTHVVDDPPGRRMLDRFLALLEPLGAPIRFPRPELSASSEVADRVRAQLSAAGIDRVAYAVIHPGARTSARCWPAERFAAAARHLAQEHALAIVLVGGPSEVQLCDEIARAAGGGCIVLAGRLAIDELVALCAGSAIYLGNDTGPAHLAAASGAATVTLFGQQSPQLWTPAALRGRVVRAPQPCGVQCLKPANCDRRNPDTSFCVGRIAVEDVIRAVDELLAEPVAAGSAAGAA